MARMEETKPNTTKGTIHQEHKDTITQNKHKQVLPKVIWERACRYPHDREWTCPLCVLLAAQYPLQTNPITQPQLCYIYTAMPHASYTLHCTSCPILPPPKKK